MGLFSKKTPAIQPKRRQIETSERATEKSLEDRYTFRRNRTLTGSVSSKVVSTNETNAQLKSSRVHAHELTKKRRHIGGILLLVLAVSALLYALITQFTAGVVIRAKDISLQLDTSYETILQDYFAAHPAERLRFMTNSEQLLSFVQTRAPEVASLEVDGAAGFGKSQFIMTVRDPIAGWSINGRQQYVDTNGVPFERNYFSSPKVQIIDNSGVQVEAGQAVASNRFLAFVGRAVGLAKAQGYSVTQVIIPSGTTRQVELRLEGVAYTIKFSIDRGAGEQVEDMVRAVGWAKANKVSPQYLDVRVSGKAYYR